MKTLHKMVTILLIIGMCSTAIAKESLIPVKDFFKNPDYTSLQLSPNGKYLALLSPINERRNIVLMELDNQNNLTNPRALTGLSNQDIASFF